VHPGDVIVLVNLVVAALVLRFAAGGRVLATIGLVLETIGGEIQWYGSNRNWTLTHDHIDMLIAYPGGVLLWCGLERSHRLRAIAKAESQMAASSG
jgi:hypothetical protein